ncbi:MAG: 3D domain-containing protein [Planctomycetota bacterium]|nr:MAG: 3D domain-containing protein [Planctomycetota bacterium]
MLLYIAVFCVLSCIIVISHAKPNSRIPLLSATTEDQTRIISRPLDNFRQPDKWRTIQMCVTAYCPCRRCCGEYSNGKTACGYKINPGDSFVAADSKYPFGTEMLIAGYNNGEPVKVLDRGGVIRGNKLDVFFNSHKQALQWGVRYLDVKIRSN